ncbi:MAG: hypothetical protein K0S81_1786 [Rhodospirillales bacterium]|jgi:hypothetical protein|nr:hypothetical protein [Rhodospirillales bacterium]
MTSKTAALVCGMAMILATLAAQKGNASNLNLADPTSSTSVVEFGSRIDDNGARGK